MKPLLPCYRITVVVLFMSWKIKLLTLPLAPSICRVPHHALG